MAIGNIGFDAIKVQEIKSREFALGLTKVQVLGIYDGHDNNGDYLNFCFYQQSSGKSTLRATALNDVRYEEDPRGYYEVAHSIVRVYINDRFMTDVVAAIGENMPCFADACNAVGIANALNALEGRDMTVWFTRTKKGNLIVSFGEKQYRYRLSRGDTGGADLPAEGKELNEEAPF